MFALTPQRSNRLWLWGGLAIIVLAEVCLSPWLRIFPNGIVEDDGYFYAKIAMNIGASGRSTFDGIHSTSGYHLAWGGILGATSAVLRIFTTNPWIHLSVFHTIGLAAIWIAIVQCISQPALRFAIFALAAVNFGLTETAILAAALLFLARVDWSNHSQRLSPSVCILMFAVPLIRIDGAAFLFLPAAYFAFRANIKAQTALLFLALGVLTQLALMYAIFGEFFSVAALIKASPFWLHPGARLIENSVGAKTTALKSLATAIALVFLVVRIVRRRREPATHNIFLVCVSAIAFLGIHLFATRMRNWYWVPPMALLGAAIDQCTRTAALRASTITIAAGAFTLATIVGAVAIIPWYQTDRANAALLVDAVSKHVPPNGRIYQIDGTGYVGFATQRAVVNGDGLVNNHSYLRRVRTRQLEGYLDEENICWIITNQRMHRNAIIHFGGLEVLRTDVDEQFAVPTIGRSKFTDFRLFYRKACATTLPL